MFVKVSYVGYFPLGSDLEINGIKIMQSKWKKLCKPTILAFGKRMKGVIPTFCEKFVVETNGKKAFFLAYECGIGKYHIFKFSDKSTEKLSSYPKIKTK